MGLPPTAPARAPRLCAILHTLPQPAAAIAIMPWPLLLKSPPPPPPSSLSSMDYDMGGGGGGGAGGGGGMLTSSFACPPPPPSSPPPPLLSAPRAAVIGAALDPSGTIEIFSVEAGGSSVREFIRRFINSAPFVCHSTDTAADDSH